MKISPFIIAICSLMLAFPAMADIQPLETPSNNDWSILQPLVSGTKQSDIRAAHVNLGANAPDAYIIYFTSADWCGSSGCNAEIAIKDPTGKWIDVGEFSTDPKANPIIGPTQHVGMYDITLYADYTVSWNASKAKYERPASNEPSNGASAGQGAADDAESIDAVRYIRPKSGGYSLVGRIVGTGILLDEFRDLDSATFQDQQIAENLNPIAKTTYKLEGSNIRIKTDIGNAEWLMPRYWHLGDEIALDNMAKRRIIAVGFSYRSWQSMENNEYFKDCIRFDDRDRSKDSRSYDIYCKDIGWVSTEGSVGSQGLIFGEDFGYAGIIYNRPGNIQSGRDIQFDKSQVGLSQEPDQFAARSYIHERTDSSVDMFDYYRPATAKLAIVGSKYDNDVSIFRIVTVLSPTSFKEIELQASPGQKMEKNAEKIYTAEGNSIRIDDVDHKTHINIPRFVEPMELLNPAMQQGAMLSRTDVVYEAKATHEKFNKCLRAVSPFGGGTSYTIYCREAGIVEDGLVQDGNDKPMSEYVGITYEKPVGSDLVLGQAKALQ